MQTDAGPSREHAVRGTRSPALGLSLLKPIVRSIGATCEVRYLNVAFAEFVGVEAYQHIQSGFFRMSPSQTNGFLPLSTIFWTCPISAICCKH